MTWLESRRAPLVVIVVALALAAASIAIGFLTDDHAFRAMLHAHSEHAPAAWDLFRFESGDPAGNALRVRVGHLAWWAAPDLKIHFLRPLTSGVLAADDAVAGTPLSGHLISLAFQLALLVCAHVWFRRILPPAAATLALAVFGLSAAHVEAYGWISARHVVLAAAFAAASLAARRRPVALLLLALGLAASEATLAVLPIWLARECLTGAPWRTRLARFAPALALGVAYLVLYTLAGAGTRGSGGYHDPAADPLGFALLALARVPILLGDAALGIPAELAHRIGEPPLALLGVAATAFVATAAWRTRASNAASSVEAAGTTRTPDTAALAARDAAARGSLLWLALAGAAGCVLGAAGYPAGRMLVIPDLAFAPVLGLVVQRALVQRRGRALAGVLAVMHLGIAPLHNLLTVHRLAVRAVRTRAIADEIRALAPASGRVYLLAASDPMVYLYPRGILADVAPGTLRCWTTFSGARSRHRVARLDAHRFTIEALDRPLLTGFDQLFRAPDRPFAVGDRVDQCGAQITVAAVDHGRPTKLDVTFRRTLDDPELAFVIWRDHHLERFTFTDAATELPNAPGPSGL